MGARGLRIEFDRRDVSERDVQRGMIRTAFGLELMRFEISRSDVSSLSSDSGVAQSSV